MTRTLKHHQHRQEGSSITGNHRGFGLQCQSEQRDDATEVTYPDLEGNVLQPDAELVNDVGRVYGDQTSIIHRIHGFMLEADRVESGEP